jgi:hypothetical protein
MDRLIAKTQKEEVLMYLKRYGKISTIEASNKLFIADLRSIIRYLRKKMNIGDEWVYKKNKFGRPCRFKRYFIDDKKSFWERLRFFM